MRNHILKYSALVSMLYVVLVLATWLIFGGDDITIGNAMAGAVVYLFYIVIVFGALILGSVVAYLLKRERDETEHDVMEHEALQHH
jgi:membrane protein YqaA with SNARE-associated domain